MKKIKRERLVLKGALIGLIWGVFSSLLLFIVEPPKSFDPLRYLFLFIAPALISGFVFGFLSKFLGKYRKYSFLGAMIGLAIGSFSFIVVLAFKVYTSWMLIVLSFPLVIFTKIIFLGRTPSSVLGPGLAAGIFIIPLNIFGWALFGFLAGLLVSFIKNLRRKK